MNKQEYYKLLLADEWVEYSYLIKRRDNFRCVKCGSNRFLNAHHLAYRVGLKPWDYPQSWVITLCRVCHKAEHEKNDISTFFKKETPINPYKKTKKSAKKKKKKEKFIKTKHVSYRKLTRKEQKVQEYRNKMKSEGKLI